ncbi:MAG: tetratricopeptide repeat protein [Paralcaligenes sp.]
MHLKKLQASMKIGIEHHKAGRTAQAVSIYSSILKVHPHDPQALYLLGLVAQESGDHKKAVALFTKGRNASPTEPVFHLQLGISLNHLGAVDDAISSYRKALALNPAYVEAHCNLGNVLARMGDTDGAIGSYRRALQLAPDLAQIHYNIGVLFQEQFQPEKAIECFRDAIRHKEDYAAAYNNLGVALSETGFLDEAITCYRKAQELAPDFADPFYNLHALLLSEDGKQGSIASLEEALKIQPDNDVYRFSLGMLHDYAGDTERAASYFGSMPNSESFAADLDAWNYLKSLSGARPFLMGNALHMFKFAIDHARADGLVLEFGVFHGKSIRLIASLVDTAIHGFDSFEGIPEDWNEESKGSYSTRGAIPKVPAHVHLHAGWFEDSIPAFAETERGPIRFMNIDCDLYSSTRTVLDLLAAQVVSGTVIVFDEYIGNKSWRNDEFKAFNEAAQKHQWSYEILCFSFVTRQVAIRISNCAA